MLQPNKHMNPGKSTLALAAVLLKHIRERRVEAYAEFFKVAGQSFLGADVVFVPALSLLFLLGLVDYLPKTDSFQYCGT